MEVQFELNGKPVCTEIEPGAVLFDILRSLGCYSVKCGCETTNCGLCTVWVGHGAGALYGRQDTKPGRDPGVPGRKSLSVYGICRTTPGSGKVSERKKRIDV